LRVRGALGPRRSYTKGKGKDYTSRLPGKGSLAVRVRGIEKKRPETPGRRNARSRLGQNIKTILPRGKGGGGARGGALGKGRSLRIVWREDYLGRPKRKIHGLVMVR